MRTIFIFNSEAKKAKLLKGRIKKTLKNMNISGQFIEVKKRGEAKKIAAIALEKGIDRIVAIGGDGMTNDIIQVIAKTNTILGLIPIGENNLVAHILGIKKWSDGCLALRDGSVTDMDLGIFDDKYFTASIEIEGKQQKSGGFMKKVLKKDLISYYPVAIDLKNESDALHFQGEISKITVSPFPFHGKKASNEFLSDQLLHIKILSKSEKEKRFNNPEVSLLQGNYIEISGKHPLSILADGEKSGKTPVIIGVEPKAVKVIIPTEKNAKETDNIAETE